MLGFNSALWPVWNFLRLPKLNSLFNVTSKYQTYEVGQKKLKQHIQTNDFYPFTIIQIQQWFKLHVGYLFNNDLSWEYNGVYGIYCP